MEKLNINRAGVYDLELVLHSRSQAHEILNKRELLGDFTPTLRNSWI